MVIQCTAESKTGVFCRPKRTLKIKKTGYKNMNWRALDADCFRFFTIPLKISKGSSSFGLSKKKTGKINESEIERERERERDKNT